MNPTSTIMTGTMGPLTIDDDDNKDCVVTTTPTTTGAKAICRDTNVTIWTETEKAANNVMGGLCMRK